jgi:hypothetical protein
MHVEMKTYLSSFRILCKKRNKGKHLNNWVFFFLKKNAHINGNLPGHHLDFYRKEGMRRNIGKYSVF